MNDADRKAAEQQYSIAAFDYASNPIGSRDWTLYWDGWKACCEWRDSQVGEPVAMNDAVSKHQTDAYAKLIEIRNNIDLAMMDLSKAHHAIATPPTAQINQQLTALLEKSLHWLGGLCDAGPLGQQYPSDELTQFVDDIRAALAATQ